MLLFSLGLLVGIIIIILNQKPPRKDNYYKGTHI
jgi:hypothetical protein